MARRVSNHVTPNCSLCAVPTRPHLLVLVATASASAPCGRRPAQVGQGEQALSRGEKAPPARPDLLPSGLQPPGQEPQGAVGQINRGWVDKHAKLLADAGDLDREPVYQELRRCAGPSNARSSPPDWKRLKDDVIEDGQRDVLRLCWTRGWRDALERSLFHHRGEVGVPAPPISRAVKGIFCQGAGADYELLGGLAPSPWARERFPAPSLRTCRVSRFIRSASMPLPGPATRARTGRRDLKGISALPAWREQ